jgi:hypothetical protein
MPTATKPTREAIAKGYHGAFVESGFIDALGMNDNGLLREALFEHVGQARVSGKAERRKTAITKWDLTALVFPSAVPPEGNEDQLIEVVWRLLLTHVWNQCSVHAGANNMQRYVGGAMGGGWTLCRTKVKDDAPAVYVTEDYGCIVEDKRDGETNAVKRAIERDQREVEMHMSRQPEYAKKYERTFSTNVSNTLKASSESLKLTLETVTAGITDEADSE